MVTPFGDVELRLATKDGKQIVESFPLTFALTFLPKNREEDEFIARRRVEITGGTKTVQANFAYPEFGRSNMLFDDDSSSAELHELREGNDYSSVVLFPFDVNKISDLGVVLQKDESYDKYLQERERSRQESQTQRQRLREERQREIEESRPSVVKELIGRGFQILESSYREEPDVLSQIPLSDYLSSLGSSGEDINVEGFTLLKRVSKNQNVRVGPNRYYVRESDEYVITDGKATSPTYQEGVIKSPVIGLEDATYLSSIRTISDQEENRFIYFLETSKSASEIRQMVKELGIKTLKFTLKPWWTH